MNTKKGWLIGNPLFATNLIPFLTTLILTIGLGTTVILVQQQQQNSTHAQTAATPDDWPQVGHDPQHTSLSPETLGTNFQIKWRYVFQPERVYPQVQAIVYARSVFVPTESGNIYAFDAVNGPSNNQPKWKFTASGPIVASVAADNGLVFSGSLDGAIYAIDSSTGIQVWRSQLSAIKGFSTSPLIAEGKVFIGGRDGYMYALDQTTGSLVWKTNLNAPILMTAAYDNATGSGRVFVGTMGMYIYSLDSATGSIVWKSFKITGISFKDYWPVITQGKVIVVPLAKKYNDGIPPSSPFGWYGNPDTDWGWLSQSNSQIASGNASQNTQFMSAQNNVMSAYAANPGSFIPMIDVLNESTGATASAIPHFDTQQHNGGKPPPCVDRDGNIIIPVVFVRSSWGVMNLTQSRYVDVLYDGNSWQGQPLQFNGNNEPANLGEGPAGGGNSDENVSVSCSQNLVLGFHYEEENANYTGFFNLNTRKWTMISHGWTNGQQFTTTESGGADPPTISNSMVYHITIDELIARTTN